MKLRKRILGENHPDYAQNLNNLALLYKSQGRYEQAEPLYIQALKICEQILGTKHPNTKKTRDNLEIMQREKNKKNPLWKKLFGK